MVTNDEAAAGSAGATDGGGHSPGGNGLGSPLQARAKFLQNWSWDDVVSINRGACERGRAQHGANSETHRACEEEWEKIRAHEIALIETFDTLRLFHRRAPFLFLNGNTFANIGRELSLALFSDFPSIRKSEMSSIIGHYIAGVLDREAMIEIFNGLCTVSVFKAGDHVKTFRGTSHGVVTRILEDGRVVWRSDGSSAELMARPESLLKVVFTPR